MEGAPTRQRSLNLRLTTAITSYDSREGSQFQGVVIAPYERGGRVFLPSGTIVYGSILSSKGVGLGIKPEPKFLKAGDVVTLGITGLGEQTQKIVELKK